MRNNLKILGRRQVAKTQVSNTCISTERSRGFESLRPNHSPKTLTAIK